MSVVVVTGFIRIDWLRGRRFFLRERVRTSSESTMTCALIFSATKPVRSGIAIDSNTPIMDSRPTRSIFVTQWQSMPCLRVTARRLPQSSIRQHNRRTIGLRASHSQIFPVNATGTLNLLEATRQYAPEAAFVFTSTNKVYGDQPNGLPLVERETPLGGDARSPLCTRWHRRIDEY